ncbi:RagB/SusD family nutrient uptake outer membrane protein [Pseudobacter ginsenosidimutans]|uniref:SusD-like starch-binding protein associating with outer membrane n=1 Tax=Pseudobacter ginsenosidimutans TaxID=661488 RepID=A0A4Q7N1H2_9BACT|nr:RagB/SusD family nutrient uptake outer membrane protein [Pseudobacter ginsenosidimutans]QEC44028.1 RagB/SusD family nutrient uptake outer membrane protein [Pseudobacter ginsenosidimutans]RZS75467.1 SusD-like starch-binding protein associating with outer membrane [Pseudobacter ginsenosidimutans]
MKSRYILPIIILTVLLAGCNKFLDTDNLTAKTTANFPLTEKDASEMITSIYANLLYESPETSSEIYVAQLAGDDCLGGNLSFSGNCAVNFLLYKDNLNGLLGLWSRCYRMVNRANNAIATLDNVKKWSDGAERLRHFGEAHFLRALAYYELVRIFGGVPLRTNLETENLPRATVDEVFELIASDLKDAIEMMPDKIYPAGSEMAGHATKYAAEALMARVFLFYTGRYAKQELPGGITKAQVIGWIDDCVNNSGHDLVPDQRNIWSYTNEATESNTTGNRYNYVVNNNLKWTGNSSVESVFATKYNMKADWTYTWFSNTNCLFYSPSGDNYSKSASYPFGAGWGAGPVSPAMVNEWKTWAAAQTYTGGYTTDARLTGSVWSYRALDPNQAGAVLMDTKLDAGEPDYTVSYRYYENTGYFQKKYININSSFNNNILSFALQMFPGISSQTSASLLQIADLIHIRFADVLLMQSELKEDAAGLNRVRARSHLAPVGYSLDAIKNERRWELAFESIRYWDLLRWSGPSLEEIGNALNKQTGFNVVNAAVVVPMVNYNYKDRIKKTEGYWPIPQTEIDISNGLIKQNPGWDPSAQFTDWNNY